jgi:hypothetical protein
VPLVGPSDGLCGLAWAVCRWLGHLVASVAFLRLTLRLALVMLWRLLWRC